ncbi:MAG TPA: PaaI family thioesterase [Arenicellales bacterium]|nr:PaaI family thioesterase [Arenicellales bacterium]
MIAASALNLRNIVTPEQIKTRAKGTLVEYLGMEFTAVSHGSSSAYIDLQPRHLAPNGYLHGGTVAALADTCCGYGCLASLPEGAESFTTIEFKTNFLGTAREGRISCEARLMHGGRSTQVWDADVRNEAGKVIAHFRCTQMILYPRS